MITTTKVPKSERIDEEDYQGPTRSTRNKAMNEQRKKLSKKGGVSKKRVLEADTAVGLDNRKPMRRAGAMPDETKTPTPRRMKQGRSTVKSTRSKKASVNGQTAAGAETSMKRGRDRQEKASVQKASGLRSKSRVRAGSKAAETRKNKGTAKRIRRQAA